MEQWTVVSRLADGEFKFVKGRSTAAMGVTNYPDLRRDLNAQAAVRDKGYMLAWDPAHQREAFRVPYPHPGNGGTLVTAGNLLIEGTIDKTLADLSRNGWPNSGKCRSSPCQSVVQSPTASMASSTSP